MTFEIPHISYSQYQTYERCPRSWYLTKVVQAEQRPTWYLPMGTAVHQMIEDYLDPEKSLLGPEEYFYPPVRKQMEVEPDVSQWLFSSASDGPITKARALRHVADCFSKAMEFLDDVDVWEVEYDASGSLPGLSVPIVAYVDIIGEHKKHGPVILDWKTGKQKPKDYFQLETYSALLRVRGDDPHAGMTYPKGLWAMLHPEASKARVKDLSYVDPSEVGAKYERVYQQMKKKLYATKYDKYNCKRCFQQDNCLVNAGPTDRAKYYDNSAEDGHPF